MKIIWNFNVWSLQKYQFFKWHNMVFNFFFNWGILLNNQSFTLYFLVSLEVFGEKSIKLTFQSKEVTSLLLGTSVPPFCIQCLSTSWLGLVVVSLMSHILAVLSPDLNHTFKISRSRFDNNMLTCSFTRLQHKHSQRFFI